MKILLLLYIIISFSFSDQYVFLIDKYDKEIELEAKIVSKIALSSIVESKRIKLFIPNISKQEKEIYSNYFDLTEDCKTANFIFDNKAGFDGECKKSNKLFFTNNYKRLIDDDKFYGAFFWSKSRPNIVFIKQRLEENNVKLSKEYLKYIEDMNE